MAAAASGSTDCRRKRWSDSRSAAALHASTSCVGSDAISAYGSVHASLIAEPARATGTAGAAATAEWG